MSILVGKLEFEGPYDNPELIRDEPGIFGIVCEVEDELELIELDEMESLRDCLISDEHVSNLRFYEETCHGKLSAIIHYTSDLTSKERREVRDSLLLELESLDGATMQ